MKELKFKTNKNKRYYLHRKIKEVEGVTLKAHQRTMYVTDFEHVNPDMVKLRDIYGYSIQLTL